MMAPRINILGVAVSAVDMPGAVQAIEGFIRQGVPSYIRVAAAHGLMDHWRDAILRPIFYRAAMATPEGMPLVWYLRLSGHRNVRRIYVPNLLLALGESSIEAGYTHFFDGGTEPILEDLTR
jgi:N-acetylglucosaminyldiphosphoundecaprenol N-acetyl-beta-D-mannosaminyltransferase